MKKYLLVVVLFLLQVLTSISSKSNKWVIILNTSKFWFNYRQTTNSLMIYEILRENNIPDENIILMSPDNIACNPRNNVPGVISVYDNTKEPNLYHDIEMDYKGLDVSVDNFLNIIRQRHEPNTPLNKRLRSDSESQVFIYMNGHGGNGYHKLQDTHVITDYEFAKAIEELYLKNGFKEMFILSDSCGAFTIFDQIDTPNIYMIGSSSKDEKSFSYGRDHDVMIAKTDEFSLKTYEFSKIHIDADMEQYLSIMDPVVLRGHPDVKNTFPKKTGRDLRLSDFMTHQDIKNPRFMNFSSPSHDDVDEINFLASFSQILESGNTGSVAQKSDKLDFSHYKFEPARFSGIYQHFSL